MRWLPARKVWPSLNRRFCSGLTLLAYLGAAFGLPVPAQTRAVSADRPCGSGHCACSEEAQSNHECCCCRGMDYQNKTDCGQQEADQPQAGDVKRRDAAQPVTNTKAKTTPDRGKIPWSIGISAMKCQGWSVIWVTDGAAVVAGGPLCWQLVLLWIGTLFQPNFPAHVLATSPADPPPRACLG
jgi:hypothetical protein